MAALNFPLNPNDGDVYGNYVYDATEGVWNANPLQLASRFITSATQPTSPSNGDGWLDTNTGKTYIYYNDGSSAQWIESGNPVIGFVDPYDQTTTSTGHFALPKGTSAQRPVAPENGDIRFNTDSGRPEWYSAEYGTWINFSQVPEIEVEYLVIAGGGGGGGGAFGHTRGGGGGAGGYISSVAGESSGGGDAAIPALSLAKGSYIIEVGAGGSGGLGFGAGTNGANSTFVTTTSEGGGSGGGYNVAAGSGGSGGATGTYVDSSYDDPGAGTTDQGYAGAAGSGYANNLNTGGSGGGGAGSTGTANSSGTGGNGGSGVSSSITGSSVARAGGGGGGAGVTGGSATAGGGAGAGYQGNGTAGTVNTGGGGGGASEGGTNTGNFTGGAGGAGAVIFKVPSWATPTFSVGLTEDNGGAGQTIGDYTVYTITAGTGTVTF